MAHEQGWEVGMQVFVVLSLNRKQEFHDTITKVGRKWITLSGHNPYRFDAQTMWIDGKGYTNPGRVYLSEDEYVRSTDAHKAWTALKQGMGWHAPAGLTAERINEIAKELGQ